MEWKKIVKRWWWLLAAYAVVFANIIGLVYFNLPPQYSTNIKLFVTPAANSALANVYDAPYTDRAVKTVSLLLSGEEMLERIASTTGINKGVIRASVKSNYVIGTQIIDIKIVNQNPDNVLSIAKAIPQNTEDLIKSIQKNTDEKNQIKISIAEQSLSLKEDNGTKFKVIGALIGLFLLLGYLILTVLGKTKRVAISDPADLEKHNTKYLGEFSFLPRRGGRIMRNLKEEKKAAVEVLRDLRANLVLDEKNEGITTLCITSANKGEGKSTFICALGILISELNKKVLIVDMDVRKPSIDKIFKIETDKGLTDYLEDSAAIDDIIYKTNTEGVMILPVGREKQISDLTTGVCKPKFKELISYLKGEIGFDYILLDSPAVISTADSRMIAKQSDGVILLVEQGKTFESDVHEAKKILEKVDANIIGTVLSKSKSKRKKYY